MGKALFLAGLLPLIIFCVLLIKKKIYLQTISAIVLSIGLGVLVCVLPERNADNNEVSEEWLNYLAELNMSAGDYEKADEYLRQMYKMHGDTVDGMTSQLRLAILKGDMEKAVIISEEIKSSPYKNKLDLTKSEEEFVDEAADGLYVSAKQYRINKAMYESMKGSVDNPEEYGYSEISDRDIEIVEGNEERLQDKILGALEESVEKFADKGRTEAFAEAWETVVEIGAALDNTSRGRSISLGEEECEELVRSINKLYRLYNDDKDLFKLSEIKDAYINACVLAEDYDELIEYADESADKDALAAVAYLYMSESITDEDMDSFASNADYDDVVSRCEDIYEKMEDGDYSNSEISAYEDYLDAVIARNDNMILADIEERISDTLENEPAAAGIYIQCAAINSRLDDKNKVYDNLNMAIESKYLCTDESLSNILGRMSDIADKAAADDEIMNFNEYLEAGYVQSLPIAADVITVPEEFLNLGNSYVNERRTMINVGIVKTEEFPKVQAYISTAGIDLEDKDNLEISDCGILIEDYTIEKVQYDGAQIMLVCDNSGSMGGDVEVLKSAVEKFIASRNKGEQIGIVTFDSAVLQNTGLTSNKSDLVEAVEKFGAYGGTSISAGVNAAFGEYDNEENSFNVMIVMTDGQDWSYSSVEALNTLREKCLEKNVILYTIGLGSVSAEYLKNIADSGMGSFVYSSDSIQLEELYSFIHNQLDNNYVLTYTAEDTSKQKNRVLTISDKSEGYSASREYSLAYTDETKIAAEIFVENPKEVYVTKLGTSIIIKGVEDNSKTIYEFTILGKGFSRAESISVSVNGKRDYVGLDIKAENDQKLTVSLPYDVDYGTYDVLVNVDGTSYTLRELSIIKATDREEVVFGDYVFRAYSIAEDEGSITLNGNVTMNDYLCFNGDITLDGSLEGNVMVISDEGGAYINGKGILPGLLEKYFDNKIYIPQLDGLMLYKEEDKFDKFYTSGKSYYGPLEIYDPYIEVCPEYLNYTFADMSFDFPLLNAVLDYVDSPLSATGLQNKIVLAKERIGFVFNIESDISAGGELEFGAAELELDSFKLSVDSINSNYELGLAVELEDIPVFGNDESTYGFEIGIKSGRFDKIDLGADFDIPAVVLPAGLTLVTVSDFHAGVENLAGEEQDESLPSRILNSNLYGQCDVNFFKLNELIPALEAIFEDDLTILKLDDTTLGLSVANFNVSLDTTAVFMECIELGKAEVDLGCYDYENYLLGIDRANVTGVHLKLSTDLNLDYGNDFKVNLGGASQVDVNNVFAGVMASGNINYNIKFFKRFMGDVDGNCLLGMHNNATQFTVIIKSNDYMKGEEDGVRVTFTKGKFLPKVDLY